MDIKRRLRAPNFTMNDNMLLCEILDKFKHIIENKKTDGANLQQKHSAWQEVTNMYNSCTKGDKRSQKSLQQNYKNLKKKSKKQASDAKMLIPGKRKLELETSSKETVLEKFKELAYKKMELVKLQNELLKSQIIDEKEKLDHNRMLRALELEDMKRKYEFNEIIRKLELEKYKS